MLVNELVNLQYYLERQDDAECQEAAYQRVSGSWMQAVFSDAPDHSLNRYFNFHLQGISILSDTLFPLQALLLRLLDHLLESYGSYVNLDCPAPMTFRVRLSDEVSNFCCCEYPAFNSYLAGLTDSAQSFSFRSLSYLRIVLRALSSGDDADEVFLRFNFNHLGYLAQLQERISAKIQLLTTDNKITWLMAEKARITSVPERVGCCYHPDWPSLKSMLSTWLSEQIAVLPQINFVQKKIPLNLSVAQLALFLRICYEEDIFTETNLTSIFNFIAANYSTKKQNTISSGSISKHYYAPDQVTAAFLLNKLHKMTASVNKNFFQV